MKKVPVILAVVLGIVDAALVVFLVFILLQPKFGAGGEETAGTELSAEFESNAEDYYDSVYESSYASMIQAEVSGFQPSAGGVTGGTNEPKPTLTPTPAPNALTGSGLPAADFIFPESDSQVITHAEMEAKLTSRQTWQRAVNEIYARKGYQFHEDKNKTDYDYFNSKEWYQKLKKIETQEEVKAMFNSVEIKNVEALVAFKEEMGWE